MGLYTAECLGCDAATALSRATRGTIAAVFARSFYLRFDDDWVCVGAEDIGRGPLNILCPLRAMPNLRAALETGRSVGIGNGALWISGRVALSTARASVWCPPAIARWRFDRISQGLAVVERTATQAPPAEGLGVFISPDPVMRAHLARAALPAITALDQWIRTASKYPPQIARGLLGLGPGLTPSGDDFLAGMLCALRAVDRGDMSESLWRLIEPVSRMATVPVSRAHLASAARGNLSEDMHDILGAVIDGSEHRIHNGLAKIGRHDHCSPWDCLAGIVVTLRAVLDVKRCDAGAA